MNLSRRRRAPRKCNLCLKLEFLAILSAYPLKNGSFKKFYQIRKTFKSSFLFTVTIFHKCDNIKEFTPEGIQAKTLLQEN